MAPPITAASSRRRACTSPRISMCMASKSKQAYICRDCGYIYSDKTPFDKLPDKYFCPVCGAPKRRFREYQPDVSKNANDKDVCKARKAQIQKDEVIGNQKVRKPVDNMLRNVPNPAEKDHFHSPRKCN